MARTHFSGPVVSINGFEGNLVGTATNITGIVSLANGGTGVSLSPGINGQVLTMVGGFPAWAATSLAGAVTSVTASAPLASSGGSTPNITISQSGVATDGYLSSVNWNTFNNKEPAISSGTTAQYWRGDKSFQTLNPAVIASTLTGFSSVAGIVTSSDTVLSALQKVDGNQFYGIPSGVQLNNANKAFQLPTFSGLQIRTNNSGTQTNSAGAWNGSGTGNGSFVSFPQLDAANVSTFSSMSLSAQIIHDIASTGQSGVNILANFANGFYPVATDFVDLIWDGLPNSATGVFPMTTSMLTFSLLSTDRAIHAVNGTGSSTQTGDVTTGSATISNLSDVTALTVGMFFKQVPAATTTTPDSGKAFPDGTTIVSINVGGASCVVSNLSANTASGISLIQYGGVAPVNRSGTSNGTALITGIANTHDLLVGMKVTDSGGLVPANSYIVSMVTNVSITLNNNVTAGSPTLTFKATGLTGIPSNNANVGVPFTTISSNNPSMVFSNTVPLSPTWTTTDGGFPNNVFMPAFNFKTGASGSNSARMIILKQVTLNGTVYNFGH